MTLKIHSPAVILPAQKDAFSSHDLQSIIIIIIIININVIKGILRIPSKQYSFW